MKRIRKSAAEAAVVLLLIGLATPVTRAQEPPRYRLDILETFSDVSPFSGKVYEQASASARAINSAGRIAGPANSAEAITSLGDGGLFAVGQSPRRVGDIPHAAAISPQDINDLGQVVGWSSTDPGTGAYPVYAFFDDGSGPGALQLNPLAGGTNSQAFGLNENGTLVGTSDINSDGSQYRPVAWSDEQPGTGPVATLALGRIRSPFASGGRRLGVWGDRPLRATGPGLRQSRSIHQPWCGRPHSDGYDLCRSATAS
jgi:probable HAF family extracellular repeat protein